LYVPVLALLYAAAVPVAVTVSPVTKPLKLPTVTAPAVVVPSKTFEAIVGAPIVRAFTVIAPVKSVGWVRL
jgi:hypothetical protein